MAENIKLKEGNIRKIKEIAKNLMAVYTLYCYLENKKTLICRYLKLNNKIKDRTILKIGTDVRASP